MTAINAIDNDVYEQIVLMRRDLHRHPELSWQESRTAKEIGKFLDQYGVVHRMGVAGTGVVADLPGPDGVPAVALRADMDALPIQEDTGLPFSSEVHGVMHACGHDGHTSMLLGAAALLARESSLPAPVRLIFQPAEETGNGAIAMIKAGVLQDVGIIFGGHLDRHYPTGSIVVTDGAVNASSDAFWITITGRGGHAARPHETVDAVVAGSLLVIALQTIVSREVNPAHPSVLSVGIFRAGSASNVIANEARLEGSIRARRTGPSHAARFIATDWRVGWPASRSCDRSRYSRGDACFGERRAAHTTGATGGNRGRWCGPCSASDDREYGR